MRFLRAYFDGFRLLSNVDIKFSTDKMKNITVIRAANESGKTTMLTALQWGLLGDEVLPKGYSIRRMDLPQNQPSATRVEIEYEVDERTGPKKYRVVRRTETLSSSDGNLKSQVQLYDVTDGGTEELKSPNNHIRQHFPSELREVFFTDGDRALSFIEGAVTAQKNKVRNAIERMMGLSLLDMTIDHIKKIESQLRSKFDREAGTTETRTIEAQLESIDEKMPHLTKELEEKQDEISSLSDKKTAAEKDLQDALSAGNREELKSELINTQNQRDKLGDQRRAAEKRQATLLSSELISRHLMAPQFRKAEDILDELREKGQIPNKTVPILEDRLEHADCICGESLDASSPDGSRRRKYILQLIQDSLEADSIRSKVSDLYYAARPLISGDLPSWSEKYSEAFKERQQIASVYQDIGEKEAEISAKLDKIPDINLQRLREIKRTYEDNLQAAIIRATEIDSDIKHLQIQKKDFEAKFRTASAQVSKGVKIRRELSVATDIEKILDVSLNRMKTVEVQSVSDRMNSLFLDMIGAAEESALITSAKISPEFKIVVYGRNGLAMDPSIDLNGASRRALTIAFVLALTDISGVEAPNVIDTPLGMMSGFVKTEVVRISAMNSSQLILFLTHDEIKGCEKLLDERGIVAGTLTNPAHYPRILKNDPGTREATILQCGCDHRTACNICDRYEDGPSSLDQEAQGAS
jgi:DNA sulfur modification protein DndD